MAFNFSSYLKYVLIPTIGAGIMIFLLAATQLLGKGDLSIFLSSIVSGITLYMSILALMSKFFGYDLINNMKQVLNDIR